MEIGIGRGDRSRRVMGKQPTTFSQLEQFVGIFRDLTAARDERQRRAGWTTTPQKLFRGSIIECFNIAAGFGTPRPNLWFFLIGPIASKGSYGGGSVFGHN
jgi:hypothetical protein